MDLLAVFLASLAGAALSQVPPSPPRDEDDLVPNEDLRWAVAFLADRARRWAGEWTRGLEGAWPDPDALFAQILEQERNEALRDRQAAPRARRNGNLSDDWDEASEILGNQQDLVFRSLLDLHHHGGADAVTALVEMYGAEALLFPLRSEVRAETSPFGWRTHPVTGTRKYHEGQDLRAAAGTPVLAAEAGVVAYVTTTGACGWGVCIEHSPTLRTIYCHLSRIDAKKGQRVGRGVQIGLSGGAKGHPGAGRSTGAHLHFAVKTRPGPKGTWAYVDPDELVAAVGTEGAAAVGTEGAAAGDGSWWDWFWGPSAPATIDEDDGEASPSEALWGTSPGVSAVLVGTDGAEHDPGPVPPGRYTLAVSGRPPSAAVLAAGHRYKASSLGKMYEQW